MSPTSSAALPSLARCRDVQAGLIELLGYPTTSVALPLPAVTGQWQAQDWQDASGLAFTQGVISWFLHRAAAEHSGCPVVVLDALGRRFRGARVLAEFAANMSLRLGREFESELKAVGEALGTTRFAGCNTYGQVARAEGQFGGFHNCTAVVCIIPA